MFDCEMLFACEIAIRKRGWSKAKKKVNWERKGKKRKGYELIHVCQYNLNSKIHYFYTRVKGYHSLID